MNKFYRTCSFNAPFPDNIETFINDFVSAGWKVAFRLATTDCNGVIGVDLVWNQNHKMILPNGYQVKEHYPDSDHIIITVFPTHGQDSKK